MQLMVIKKNTAKTNLSQAEVDKILEQKVGHNLLCIELEDGNYFDNEKCINDIFVYDEHDDVSYWIRDCDIQELLETLKEIISKGEIVIFFKNMDYDDGGLNFRAFRIEKGYIFEQIFDIKHEVEV